MANDKSESPVKTKSEAVEKAKDSGDGKSKSPELINIARRPLRRSLIPKSENLDPHGGKVVTSGSGLVRDRS